MATWTSLYGAPGTAITLNSSTSVNSLADDAIVEMETGIDNTTNRHRYASFEFDLGADVDMSGAGYNTNPAVHLYAIPSFDGTNYADTAVYANPLYSIPEIYHIGTFGFRAKTDATDNAARRAIIEQVNLGPWKYHFAVKNDLGSGFPASGVTVKAKTFTDTATDA